MYIYIYILRLINFFYILYTVFILLNHIKHVNFNVIVMNISKVLVIVKEPSQYNNLDF